MDSRFCLQGAQPQTTTLFMRPLLYIGLFACLLCGCKVRKTARQSATEVVTSTSVVASDQRAESTTRVEQTTGQSDEVVQIVERIFDTIRGPEPDSPVVPILRKETVTTRKRVENVRTQVQIATLDTGRTEIAARDTLRIEATERVSEKKRSGDVVMWIWIVGAGAVVVAGLLYWKKIRGVFGLFS